ncbi:G/T mismatch-specific thymine DNA glycosylase isoform X1 [Megalobrama amblycephala]|uniref:G/T mismatch-specific thymine DNA glycosylase isoform X1 n=2 Tax=Megalobrama amblycephala TaxID=75352 RepID=UPI002013D3C4|nr:G/T mismatch-specific thymine DNA glycosylase isoform X1 [Megalobrama amblycephala]
MAVRPPIKMEERQYSSLTAPMDYLQYWYQTSPQQYQPEQVPHYHQMVNAAQFTERPMEDKIMTDLSVHQDPYLDQPQQHHQDSYLDQPHQDPYLDQPQQHHQDSYLDQPQQPQQPSVQQPALPTTPAKGKKRGRPLKSEVKEKTDAEENAKKAKRTLDRFNGMSVEEVMARKLPDVITHNLDMLIIGINPGLLSAFKGRHYPNPGNHFWKCLFLSGLTEEQLNHMHDQTLPERYGIGFTNMVERTTPGSKDLSNKEIREGGHQLLEKLQKYRPLIAVFNGKCIYETFCKEIFGVKAKNLEFGLQPYKVPETETVCYLMPSSSPRCAQFPRAQDKVHFYIKLKELRDQLKGVVKAPEIQETDYTFDVTLAKEDAKRLAIKEEQHDPEYEETCAHGSWGEPQQAFGVHPSTDTDQVTDNRWTMQPFADQIPDIRCSNNNRTT